MKWVDPQTHTGMHMQFMNPATYAFMQPQFYRIHEAGKHGRVDGLQPVCGHGDQTAAYWMNPASYMHVIDPNMYTAAMNPANYMVYMNPATYTGWTGAQTCDQNNEQDPDLVRLLLGD